MFLEWVWYDKAYRFDEGARSFSDIVAGESSPSIIFELNCRTVEASWDLRNWTRSGTHFAFPVGKGAIEYQQYLTCLAVVVDSLIAVLFWRCRAAGCLSEWEKWLDGYNDERKYFRQYAIRSFNGIDEPETIN
jgi:hypothetical protein